MATKKPAASTKTPGPIDMVKGLLNTRKKLLNALTPPKKK